MGGKLINSVIHNNIPYTEVAGSGFKKFALGNAANLCPIYKSNLIRAYIYIYICIEMSIQEAWHMDQMEQNVPSPTSNLNHDGIQLEIPALLYTLCYKYAYHCQPCACDRNRVSNPKVECLGQVWQASN